MLGSCASTYTTEKAAYRKELSEKRITQDDYNYLIQGNKEVHKMHKLR
jgi:hypothetical protein